MIVRPDPPLTPRDRARERWVERNLGASFWPFALLVRTVWDAAWRACEAYYREGGQAE